VLQTRGPAMLNDRSPILTSDRLTKFCLVELI